MKPIQCALLTMLLFLTSLIPVKAQDTTAFTYRLLLDFPVLDYPYLKYAAEMSANKRSGEAAGSGTPANFSDYLRGFESPSMQQALAITKDVHATNYYFNNKLWDKWIKPNTPKNKIINRIAANASAGAIDVVLSYQVMLFSPVWLHEEFHRNGMTINGIASHDDVYNRIDGGIASGSVTMVKDEDLINWKSNTPQEMVRSFEAGVESEYLLLRNMQMDNFFSRTNYPNVVMSILLTNHGVNYVNQFRKPDYDISIDTMNKYDVHQQDRDFVGWDFTPWVYDLFRPDEAYEARGLHPAGDGIERPIKVADLTGEEYDYLTHMGRLQYLNFISPFLIGVNRIKLNDHTAFNFAVRHYLTSFGQDATVDFMLDRNNKNWMLSLHAYQNKDGFFPGIEVGNHSLRFPVKSKNLEVTTRGMLWLQPDGQEFYTTKAQPGGLLQLRVGIPFGKTFSAYAETEAKTAGWVAGNPYLKSNVTMRMGFKLDIRN